MRLPILLFCHLAGYGQPALSQESVSSSLPPTRLDAPLAIAEFVPPEPASSKPVPAMRIESAVTRQLHGKQVTVLRGEPSTLPDIPRPVAAQRTALEKITEAEALPVGQPEGVFLQMGATVYDRRISVVQWRHPEHPETGYEAVVGLDFGLFANVGSFHHRGVPHSLLLMWSEVAADASAVRADWPAPVPAGAWRVTRGDTADTKGMAPLVALMDLYAAEKEPLHAALAARRKYLAEAEAWRKANPDPEPAQRTFWLRPHRGSRYLDAEGGAR